MIKAMIDNVNFHDERKQKVKIYMHNIKSDL